MNNFGHATEATATAIDSTGSAARENERYMEGLEAKTQALKSSFQQLAASVVNSGLVKGILDLANAFLQLLNTPFGTFVTQVTLLTGLLWGGSGLIKAMSVIPAFFAKAAVGAKGLAAALSLTGPQFALIAAAIAGLIIAIPKVIDKYREWTDEVYEADKKLEDYNQKLNENQTRLEELNKIPVSNRTTEINEEIDALEAENRELKTNIEYWEAKRAGGVFEKGYLGEKEISKSHFYSGNSGGAHFEGYVDSAKEALDQIVALGGVTQETLDHLLVETNDNAEKALEMLGYNFERMSGKIVVGSEQYYSDLLKGYKEVSAIMEGGVITPDTIASFDEAKSALDDFVKAAKKLPYDEYQALDEWIKTLIEDYNSLPDITNKVADAYYNVEDSVADLSNGLVINNVQLEQLKTIFPDLANTLQETNQGWVSNTNSLTGMLEKLDEASGASSNLVGIYKQLSNGMTVSQGQVEQLTRVFPSLTAVIQNNAEGYYLEMQALADSAATGNKWAIAMIADQKGVTVETINDINARINALKAEIKAFTAAGGAAGAGALTNVQYQVKLQTLLKAQQEILGTGGGGFSGGNIHVPTPPSGGGGGSKPRPTEEDPLAKQAKQFKEIIELMEHKLFLMEKENASEKDRISQLHKMQEEINRQKKWFYSQGLDQNSKYIQDLEKQWWEYEDQIKNLYKEQADIYEMLFGAVANKAQDEIDVLEKRKQEIQDQNNELEKQIALEKALDALARAKQQKVLVYKDGKMQYVEDVDAVSKAQEAVDQAKREQDVNKQLEDIDKQINKWEEMKDQWSSVTTEYQKQQDLLLIEQKLGIKLEGENWEKRLSSLQTYINRYNNLMSKATGIGPVNMPKSRVLTRGMRTMANGAPSPVAMMRMGVPSPASMMSTYSADPSVINQSPSIVIENFNPSLPNVTDGEGFAAYLKNNFWGQTLQLVKT